MAAQGDTVMADKVVDAIFDLAAHCMRSKEAVQSTVFLQLRCQMGKVVSDTDKAAVMEKLWLSPRQYNQLEQKFLKANPRYDPGIPGFDPNARPSKPKPLEKDALKGLAATTVKVAPKMAALIRDKETVEYKMLSELMTKPNKEHARDSRVRAMDVTTFRTANTWQTAEEVLRATRKRKRKSFNGDLERTPRGMSSPTIQRPKRRSIGGALVLGGGAAGGGGAGIGG